MIVGILGGTFDPPHRAHHGVARNALSSGLVDQVWFVPCLRHRFGKVPESFEHRIAMCQLLIRGEDHMLVSDIEKNLDRPGYTLDLVIALQKVHPHTVFRLIAGTDIYFERSSWHNYEEISRLAPPIYVERKGIQPIGEPTLPMPEDISSTDVRRALASGKRPLEMVPKPVLDYIDAHRLYGRKS